jgi:hypothetical protein
MSGKPYFDIRMSPLPTIPMKTQNKLAKIRNGNPPTYERLGSAAPPMYERPSDVRRTDNITGGGKMNPSYRLIT